MRRQKSGRHLGRGRLGVFLPPLGRRDGEAADGKRDGAAGGKEEEREGASEVFLAACAKLMIPPPPSFSFLVFTKSPPGRKERDRDGEGDKAFLPSSSSNQKVDGLRLLKVISCFVT